MTATYRVAIIGSGRMGGLIEDEIPPGDFHKPYGHYSAYAAIPETRVVAVANRGADRLRRFTERFGITNTYVDYREMIVKERPDIVSVTTPSWARAEPIIFAAEHGVRGIYAEKGLCASLAEADRIVAACKANRVAFNWGALRRQHDGFKRLRAAIAHGDIGEPRQVVMYAYTDLIKHHPHTLDLVSMLLGDPLPEWVEGHLVEPDNALDPGPTRPLPAYDRERHCFVPPPGREIADPMVGFFRVGYRGGAEASFIPVAGRFDVDVHGTEGRAYAWDNGQDLRVRRASKRGEQVDETIIRPVGESPTVCTIRDLIREIETGERTAGNIDVTMQSVEAQFGLAHSHLRGGQRVSLPLADRSLYIPGG
jgi:predicted dehydrogenase